MSDIIKGYSKDNGLRNQFNLLAQKTFGLDFENWYHTGYWRDTYIPYSVLKDGKVIANVSVNRMDMRWEQSVVHLIQLGTVMTDERYRNQGYIREIMEEIERDYAGRVDGMYLFANDGVLDFYPKFGYRRMWEYEYTQTSVMSRKSGIRQISMKRKEDWKQLEQVMEHSMFQGKFDMLDNIGLIMFYVTGCLQDQVYYDEGTGAFIIGELEEDRVLIHNVFSEHPVELKEIIQGFGAGGKRVVLGFTPMDTADYECRRIQEEDTTLFVKGGFFEEFESRRLMFPTLSHA